MGEIIDSANFIWLYTVRELLSARVLIGGMEANGRGQTHKATREILAFNCGVDMHYPVVTNVHRKLSKKFMFAEAYWILTGDNRLETIVPYCPPIREFSDNGVTLAGAYGPRILKQIQYVVNGLIENNNSRQAVLSIWTPNPVKSKDIPCTVSIQFLLRDNMLNLVVEMRSSDVWLGWPYDMFNFTMVGLYVLTLLRAQGITNIKLGNLYFRAGSQHLYSDNIVEASKCLRGDIYTDYKPLSEDEFTCPNDILVWLQAKRDGQPTHINFLKELETNRTKIEL